MNQLTAKLVQGISRLAFWRKPVAPLADQPAAEAATEEWPAEARVEPAAFTDRSEPRRGRLEGARVFATLSNKKVWIPGATAMLLASIATAMALKPQAAQEKEHVQAERPATPEKREQTGVAKRRVAVADAPAGVSAVAPAITAGSGRTAADTRPDLDAGNCEVSDKASVARELKSCIDSFNRSGQGRVDSPTRKAAANGPREI